MNNSPLFHMRYIFKSNLNNFYWGFLGCIFLLGFLGCATSGQVKEEHNSQLARQKYQEAVGYGSLGRNFDMIASLQEATALAPEKARYHLYLGRAYFLVGDFENSEKELKEAINLDPNLKEAHRQLGRFYMEQGKWDKAVAQFRNVMKRSGTTNPHQLFNWIALCYYNQGKFEEAIGEWLRAVEMRDNPSIRLNLALAYRDQEYFDKARDSLKQALALKPDFPQAQYEIALLYLKEQNLDRATKHFKNVVRMSPNGERAASARQYLNLINSKD